MQPRLIRTLHHESEHGRWLLAVGEPAPWLRPYLRRYEGYREHGGPVLRRREMPSDRVVLILNLGTPFRVLDTEDPSHGTTHDSFLAGLHRSYALVESPGSAHCLQVDLTPLGAWRCFGLPLHLLADRVVGLDDVLGAAATGALIGRLRETCGWAARFDLLEDYFERRLASASAASGRVEAALALLARSGGRLPIAALTQRLDCSRQQLAAAFREQVGLPPKVLARVLRVERAMTLLQCPDAPPRAEIALACGYYDQAHFNRDFRAVTGGSPGEFLRRNLGEGAGIMGN